MRKLHPRRRLCIYVNQNDSKARGSSVPLATTGNTQHCWGLLPFCVGVRKGAGESGEYDEAVPGKRAAPFGTAPFRSEPSEPQKAAWYRSLPSKPNFSAWLFFTTARMLSITS